MKKFLDENGGFQLDYRSEMYIPVGWIIIFDKTSILCCIK